MDARDRGSRRLGAGRRRWPVAIGSVVVLAVGLAVFAGTARPRGTAGRPVAVGPPPGPTPAGEVDAFCDPSEKGMKFAAGQLPDPASGRVADAGLSVPTVVRDVGPPGPSPEGMAWIPPGRFAMGSDYGPFDDARPIHPVELDGFWLDRTPVTNDQFARFVRETGYVTVAEHKPDPRDFPGVPPADLVPGSLVFAQPSGPVPLDDVSAWWRYLPGACWRRPEGPGSDLEGRGRHPAVHVSWDDAAAYARWAGKRLPAEAEWEYAARGGLAGKPFVWGDEFRPGGRAMANTWQGRFPDTNTRQDGWARTSPVDQFPTNGFGLSDMAGNVWQWCADWYRPDYYTRSPSANPTGPAASLDPQEPGIPKRVQRGGSFLCSDQYCARYMPGGRGKGAVDTGSSHVGFRCALSPRSAPAGGKVDGP